MRRTFLPLLAAACLFGGLILAPPASANNAVIVGACQLNISMSFSPALKPLPGQVGGSASGSGPCVINGILMTGSISVVLGSVGGLSCAAGYANGIGSFGLSHPAYPSPQIEAHWVNNGGTWTLFAHSDLIVFDAVGEFAQVTSNPQPATCLAGTPQSSTTLVGAIALQDPVLPVPQ